MTRSHWTEIEAQPGGGVNTITAATSVTSDSRVAAGAPSTIYATERVTCAVPTPEGDRNIFIQSGFPLRCGRLPDGSADLTDARQPEVRQKISGCAPSRTLLG